MNIHAVLANVDTSPLTDTDVDMAANIAVSLALSSDDMRGFSILTDSELAALDSDVDTYLFDALDSFDPYADWTEADWDDFAADTVLGYFAGEDN